MFKKEDEEKNNPFKDENFTTETEEKPENNDKTHVEENKETQEEKPKDKEVEALQAELDSLNNKYLRLAADFDNFRKRQMQERESLLKYGAEDTLKKIITVLDTFERAKKSVADMDECKNVKES